MTRFSIEFLTNVTEVLFESCAPSSLPISITKVSHIIMLRKIISSYSEDKTTVKFTLRTKFRVRMLKLVVCMFIIVL
jgi:hypothetical protein